MAAAFTTSSTSTPTISVAGAMMTAFTPPDYCTDVIKASCFLTTPSTTYYFIGGSSSIFYGVSYTSCAFVERDLTCGSDGYATRASACFPDDADPSGTLVFSPGIGCPAGWTTQRTILISSKTTAECCPSGHSTYSTYISCVSSISYTNEMTTALSCYRGGRLLTDTLTYTAVTSSSYSTSSPEFDIVWAQRMQVVLASPEVTFSHLSEPTASDVSVLPSPAVKRNSHLSIGAIVGIVLGVVGALLLAGAFIIWRRRQQKHNDRPFPRASTAGAHDVLPEFVGGNRTSTAPSQTISATSNGMFQPQPELRSPR